MGGKISRRVKPRRPHGVGVGVGVPEKSKRAHLRVPVFKNTTKIQREDTQRGKKGTNFAAGEGKKRAKFWAVPGRAVPGRAVPGAPNMKPTLKHTHKHTQTHTHKHTKNQVEVSLAKVGLAEVGLAKVGWPKLVLAKVGFGQSRP